ncbi:MAG: esterase [Spirochaetes bacterium]|nr:esterase [Spirochaetota bacterium]
MKTTQKKAHPQTKPKLPVVISPEVSGSSVTFRIYAPRAKTVLVSSNDMTGVGPRKEMKKARDGVWKITIANVVPGEYRYCFTVDGVAVIDPVNPAVSESNNNVWSLVYVSGSDISDTMNVPHGAVASVTYYSASLKRFRRMQVYTPPGYENGKDRYPVLYLLHGSSDSDASWSTVGRANFILDNLIASRKARPMIVVMPAGHTARSGGPRQAADEFANDFLNDIMPHSEKHYRIKRGRQHRAMAGLSMGGGQTLYIGIPHLDMFSYLGVFSAGIWGITGDRPGFEETHRKTLDDASLKKGLKLFWFATGKDDFLLETSRATVAMFKRHDFDVIYRETDGAHSWAVWRDYLNEFVPQLFR